MVGSRRAPGRDPRRIALEQRARVGVARAVGRCRECRRAPPPRRHRARRPRRRARRSGRDCATPRPRSASSSSLELAQQVDDLRLQGDVEGGSRLVGDQERGDRSSSAMAMRDRAGACRRRTDADSGGCARSGSGMPTRRISADGRAPAARPRCGRRRDTGCRPSACRRQAPGSERAHRVLEHHGDVLAAERGRAPAAGTPGHRARRIGTRPARTIALPASSRVTAQITVLLPRPALADDAEDAAARHRRDRHRAARGPAPRRS